MAQDLGGGQIRVEAGDTLWGIAQKFLGDGSRWRELGFAGDPRSLQIGTVLRTGGQTTSPSAPVAPKTPSGTTQAPRTTQPAQPVITTLSNEYETLKARMLAGQEIWDDNKLAEAWNRSYKVTPGQADPVQQLIDSATADLDKLSKDVGEFRKNNPFTFDELQARSSAEERFDPFYNQEKDVFLRGINSQRGRSMEDERDLLSELTALTEKRVGREREAIDQAIRDSEEGFAGAGLFESGMRESVSGRQMVSGTRTIEDLREQERLRGEDIVTLGKRTREDLALQQEQQVGKTGVGGRLGESRERDILVDIERSRREAGIQRGIQLSEIVGRQNPLQGLTLEQQYLTM